MMGASWIETTRSELERLKRIGEQALAQVPDNAFFTELSDVDNSLAIVVKHLAGNMRSRWRDFLTTDGEKPDRNRDSEFVIGPNDSRERLMEAWEGGWGMLFAALAELDDGDAGRTVTVRGKELTVLQAVSRQLVHYAYHVGQMVYLARHFAGADWQTLSLPRVRP
jgi:hypothetical protein